MCPDGDENCCEPFFCSPTGYCMCIAAGSSCDPDDEYILDPLGNPVRNPRPPCCAGLGCGYSTAGTVCKTCTRLGQVCDITKARDCCASDGECGILRRVLPDGSIDYTPRCITGPDACYGSGVVCRPTGGADLSCCGDPDPTTGVVAKLPCPPTGVCP
jgi:hypothetical protein